jgi:hypothetical protein
MRWGEALQLRISIVRGSEIRKYKKMNPTHLYFGFGRRLLKRNFGNPYAIRSAKAFQ